MLDKLYSGIDLHTEMAADSFGISVAEVDPTMRTIGKFANFSLGYAGGWKMFQGKVNKDADITGVSIDAKTAKMVVDAWRKKNSKTVKWWGDVERQVREKGYLTNAYGRKRIFIDKSNVNAMIAYLPQSTVADHLNGILITVDKELDGEEYQYLLQVHDEILGQAPKRCYLRSAKRLLTLMSKPVRINNLDVPIPADVSVSRTNWAEMREVKV